MLRMIIPRSCRILPVTSLSWRCRSSRASLRLRSRPLDFVLLALQLGIERLDLALKFAFGAPARVALVQRSLHIDVGQPYLRAGGDTAKKASRRAPMDNHCLISLRILRYNSCPRPS